MGGIKNPIKRKDPIGRGSSIGGNVWLTRSVPPGRSITQAQARSEVFHDGGGI